MADMDPVKNNLFIGEGVVFTGSITAPGKVTIHGKVSGELVADDLQIGRFGHVASTLLPISIAQNKKGKSAISSGETFMGVQAAGMQYADPQNYKKMLDKKGHTEDAVSALHALNAKRAAEGKTPLRGPEASKFIKFWRPPKGNGIIDRILNQGASP